MKNPKAFKHLLYFLIEIIKFLAITECYRTFNIKLKNIYNIQNFIFLKYLKKILFTQKQNIFYLAINYLHSNPRAESSIIQRG